ncbi:peptidase associated/transthyretin-like domain-containing protein [Zavarzinella formosa]|uniref:hypothetical protein n=1 Tax=Zavarzinella formosa TaxID=360055 RepID=UPI0002EC985B|nr:hypothetical protein [Zavarzinella formosa]
MKYVRAMRSNLGRRALVLSVTLLAFIGCGAGTGELSGTVTYNSKPLRMGSVVVSAGDGTVVVGQINDDGSYSIIGVPSGSAKIGVSSPKPKADNIHMRKKDEKAPAPALVEDTSKWMSIPEKYADFKGSNLGVDIKAGKNVFNIDLK